MSYVHVNPGLNDHVGELPPNLSYLENLLSEILGRASVPALSVLGGYLAVMAYGQRRSWAIYVGERWQTLVVPLIGWNAIIILL
ncbi:hypothetical protein [Hydrogenophaga sp.]|uniref:hypothetical protein n=1 Tax=Hydrogenophaga sp. TaxID=1904254 RepID=UPI002724B457|nr:hypothetical protein [Hydrogenophaga sp.]MDO8904297.1 hypothetical protein [Hydrogenophaga sp.]